MYHDKFLKYNELIRVSFKTRISRWTEPSPRPQGRIQTLIEQYVESLIQPL